MRGGGGGRRVCGGFFLACEDFGRMLDHSLPVYALFVCMYVWRLARSHLFHSSGKDRSTMAQRAEMTKTTKSISPFTVLLCMVCTW